MKIGIDCRVLMSQSAGVRYYVLNLIKNLASIDDENLYRLYYHYFRNHGGTPFLPKQDNFSISRNFIPKPIFDRLRSVISPWDFLGDIEVFHAPAVFFDEYSPKNAPPIIITIPDIAFKIIPGIQTPEFIEIYNTQISRAVRYAEKILTISDCTARDLVEHFPDAEGKTQTVYLGVETPQKNDKVVESPFEFPYFLFVSTIEPRKNIEFLIRVFEKAVLEAKLPHRLVLVGGRGWLSEGIYEAAANSPVKDKIIFTGKVDFDKLSDYYKSAELFLFPSLYEGFGYTPLEAQSYSVPVVASNVSSLPELLTGSAELLPIDDEAVWVDTIIRLVNSSDAKKELIEKGLQNVKKYTPEKTAEETLTIYKTFA